MYCSSLGQAAVFLIGGLTREERATPIILRSGDVLVMSGPRCRRAFHGKSLPGVRKEGSR
jgi:alkylated DNA repair protein alkB homolog 1